MNSLHHRIVEISKKYNLSHAGSNLTSVGIIEEIFAIKKFDEKFILSCGHSAVALYVILEQVYGIDAEQLFLKHGVHPSRCEEEGIYCSSGSLGHGLGIALGMALADRTKDVYCLISDGELAEGSVYEAANVMHKYNVKNLKVYLNFNGWSAYDEVPQWMINNIIKIMPCIEVHHTRVEAYGLEGLSAHYVKL
jgi:transketolase